MTTILQHFVDFRHEIVVRRTEFELKEAEARAHILEGLKIALDNIDEVIEIIRGSKDGTMAKEGLMNGFNLSEIQAQAILDMRLQKLTGLEVDKVVEEYKELIKHIAHLKGILESKSQRMEIIKNEMIEEEKVEEEKVEDLMIEEEKVEDLMIEEEKGEIEMKDQVMANKEEIVETQVKRERSLEEDNQSYFWIKSEGEQKISTENLIPGNQVYKEKLIIKKGIEYRLWDPFRSKLAASIMNRLENFPFKNNSKVLYLGASTGTTVSHISDIVGPNGVVFAVEHASRVARDFLDRVASYRKNIIPILQDARKPKEYFSVFGKVDVVYVDIAQPDQTKIAIDNCDMFLKKEGLFFLVIKTRSIDVTKAPKKIVEEEIDKLREKFEILESIDLHPYDKDHAMVIARYKN